MWLFIEIYLKDKLNRTTLKLFIYKTNMKQSKIECNISVHVIKVAVKA